MSDKELIIPKHIGIIVDGNGRWAQKQGLSRSMGHKAGAENLTKICQYAIKRGVAVLSLFVFSTENFKRSVEEVNYLMNLFVKKFQKDAVIFNKENIKVVFSGRREPLNEDVLKMIDKVTEMTKNNTRGTLNLCLNYGGQYEIIDAVKKIVASSLDINNLTPETFSKFMYNDLPPIDFLIRTSGEKRISNFMLWQSSYAEFYFPETFFPDFKEKEFDLAILKYNERDRRFGGIEYETKSN